MKFLIDAQLPPSLVKVLRKLGHDALHVDYVLSVGADDLEIWQYALTNNFIIISKDEDFANQSHRQTVSPVIIWLRIGNIKNSLLLDSLENIFPHIIEMINQGERLIEIR